MLSGGQLMVVLIVAIGVIGGIIKARHKSEASARPDAEAMRLRDEIRTLKERISVLERVITDNHSSVNLDREIERLRDEDRV